MEAVGAEVPSSPNYVRNYQEEYANESDSRKKHRSERNKARRMAAAFYGEAAIKNKDVDHIKPLDQGGSNKISNLRPRSKHSNRSYARTPSAQMK